MSGDPYSLRRSGLFVPANTVLKASGWGQITNPEISNLAVGSWNINGGLTANRVLKNTDASGTTAWAQIVDADVASAAAIALSKLAPGTSGVLKSNGTTISAGNQIANADVAAAAAIAYSKLALGNSVGTNDLVANAITTVGMSTDGSATSTTSSSWAYTGHALNLTGLTLGSRVLVILVSSVVGSVAGAALYVGVGLDITTTPSVCSTATSSHTANLGTAVTVAGYFIANSTNHNLYNIWQVVGGGSMSRYGGHTLVAVEFKR